MRNVHYAVSESASESSHFPERIQLISASRELELSSIAQGLFRGNSGEAGQGTHLAALSGSTNLSEDEGYEVQSRLLRLHEAAGAKRAGYKIGLTSAAARSNFGASAPAVGFLLQHSIWSESAWPGFQPAASPSLEAEIAFVLGEDVSGPDLTAADILRATERVLLAVEVVESRWPGGPAGLGALIADNVSGAGVVLGAEIDMRGVDLSQIQASISAGGRESAGSGANVFGHPAAAVAWLAGELHRRGQLIRAGELVMSGTLCTPVPAPLNGPATVDFGTFGLIQLQPGPNRVVSGAAHS